MQAGFWIGIIFIMFGALAYHRASMQKTAFAILAVVILFAISGILSLRSAILLLTMTTAIFLGWETRSLRYFLLMKPLLNFYRRSLPKMSQTEETALKAGTVGFDGELFSGVPNWQAWRSNPKPTLSAEEKAFISGPLNTLCTMIDDWSITEKKDLPKEMWKFLKKEKFFALIIPKKFGGLEFSALAHSEILATLAGRSITVASTVAVPNSLGPAELLLHYGTEQQQEYYLPRLAIGDEIPCFALTNPNAGSDATSIPDYGIVSQGTFKGKKILGIRLTWNKRYITLAPIATVLGLAFRLYDPESLLGNEYDIGITCALIPTDTKGVQIGRRHLPLNAPFQNGPTQGSNVFIPLDWIIGGPKMAGQGWRMLVECLSAGRAISLPSSASGSAKAMLKATSAYARIRKQFKQSINQFEGVQEVLTRMAANVYVSEAARKVTTVFIDKGEKPSVLGAIIKYHLTEKSREVGRDAMDIQGGKGIMTGPRNYLANAYTNAPIGITVEGANILTRNMIIFGQGAVRCHPYVSLEMSAVREKDESKALDAFDKAITAHIQYSLSNLARSFYLGLGLSFTLKKPSSGAHAHWYNKITHASSAFASISDGCMLILGGKLKHRERISARLGDLLSLMYLASTVLKRFEDEDMPAEDLPLIDWVMQDLLSQFWNKMSEILENLPNKLMAVILSLIIMPLGTTITKPSDLMSKKVARLFLSPSATRSRLTEGVFISDEPESLSLLEAALQRSYDLEGVETRLMEAVKSGIVPKNLTLNEQLKAAAAERVITIEELDEIQELEALKDEIIAVDDFKAQDVA